MIRNVLTPFLMALAIILFQEAPMCEERPAEDNPPASVVINYLTSLYTPVNFDHQLHADYAACSECHHHTTGLLPSRPYCATCHQTGKKAASVACRSCHRPSQGQEDTGSIKTSEALYHIDIPGLKGAYHLSCMDCHEIIGTGPTECDDCHTLTARGEEFYQTSK